MSPVQRREAAAVVADLQAALTVAHTAHQLLDQAVRAAVELLVDDSGG